MTEFSFLGGEQLIAGHEIQGAELDLDLKGWR